MTLDDLSPMKMRHSISQRGVAAIHVILWFALNMVITNLNKWIFHRYAFGYPGFLTCLHMVACYALGRLSLACFFTPSMNSRRPSAQTLGAVRWLSLVFVMSVACGNIALKHIHISFAQAIGATAPLWTVLLSVLITQKTYPLVVYFALVFVSMGMWLCVAGEINFDWLGFLAVLFATVTRALKSILQGILLAGEGLDSISLLYYMSQPACVLLALWVLIAEHEVFVDPKLADKGLWGCMLLSAGVSFFLNVAQFMVTKYTSAVTLQVLGNIKVVLLIGLSVAIFRNEVSVQSIIGCAVSLSGVALYNFGSHHRHRPPPHTFRAATNSVSSPAQLPTTIWSDEGKPSTA
eukprot:CAMPEP_0119318728 /NCGR_PEP_ID=MMETSP1333-20130426/47434_1 /TAXON_ID=418940 /ORGANISM="Scyphosphaera apsteinii, Strain RCC1455" /LENGTH=348 /DNA_ID=CAMNT_0007324981 /DNA_START=11 /DNA_END=1057 /DNA_ORIENTATION=-